MLKLHSIVIQMTDLTSSHFDVTINCRPTNLGTQSTDNSFIKKLKSSGRSLVVFYGSQTGTGEEFAGRLAKEGIRYRLKGMVADPEECDMVRRITTYVFVYLMSEIGYFYTKNLIMLINEETKILIYVCFLSSISVVSFTYTVAANFSLSDRWFLVEICLSTAKFC